MPRLPISRATFDALYEAVREKLLNEKRPVNILNPDGSQNTVALGTKWKVHDTGKKHNASSVIHETLVKNKKIEAEANYNFGDMLYKKRLFLEKHTDKETVVVEGDDAYLHGLPRYLGHEDLYAFEKKLKISSGSSKKVPSIPEPEPEKTPTAPKVPYTYYIGTYYSFRSYRVNKFVLAIQYTDPPTQPMECWQWGFHVTERFETTRNKPLPKKVNSVLFTGKAEVRGSHLYINLLAAADDNQAAMEMHLMGLCDEPGGVTLHNQESIPCSLQTISLDQKHLVSVEARLLRCTEDEARRVQTKPADYYGHHISADALQKKPGREDALKLYYMLQRHNFRVKFKANASSLDDLEYRGNAVSNYTERLKGEYRIWNFGLRRGVVLQSKLVVGTDVPYQALFYPYLEARFKQQNAGLDEQLALLVISNNIRRDQLCFSTFIRSGLTLVNHAIFDIREINDSKFVEGMFITTGYNKKGIIGGYAVMCKVKDNEKCEPCCMEPEEAERYAEEHGLTEMHEGLRNLWKRKLWKRRSNTQFECYAIITDSDKRILLMSGHNGPFSEQFELPGGKLLLGETVDEGIQRIVEEKTGMRLSSAELWANKSHKIESSTSDKPKEDPIHLLGALYWVEIEPSKNRLKKNAIWVKPDDYGDEAFSPFTLMAINALKTRPPKKM